MTPADAVAWTLYLPAVFDVDAAGASLGRVAPLSLGAVAADAAAPLLVQRAALLLQIGRIDEARPALAQALKSADARTASDAHALGVVIALADNDKAGAIELARQAVRENPVSSGALIALSYAQQAQFQIEAALASARGAVRLDEASALAWARRAELEMSLGNLDAALAAAREATQRDPWTARTQSVLGFAHLAAIDAAQARDAFARALALDKAVPLPRLGLGLATIRQGALAAGRAEIEIAAILDPGNSLIRSYLGKAYYDEKRDDKAAPQFTLAAERDPRDPTPHYYGAVLAQADGHPVEALQSLQRSIALNDNRAVYRSRLLLDQDQAARSARLAYTYRELGFEQIATVEAVKSLSLDPTDAAAHRFLADSYL